MNEIEETAVKTFSLVPEIYQQIFIEKGVNFPDQLVEAIKKDPAQASQLLEGDKQLKNAVVDIFKTNQDKIMQAVQSFKKGGKLDYLQQGGITRRDTLALAMQNKGYNRQQARMAYANARNMMRKQGLRGQDLSNAIAKLFVNQQQVETPKIDTTPVANLNTPTISAPAEISMPSAEDRTARRQAYVDSLSFSDAFGDARRGGASTFMWRGKSYGTQLANPRDRRGLEAKETYRQLTAGKPYLWQAPYDGTWRTMPVQVPYRENVAAMAEGGEAPEGRPFPNPKTSKHKVKNGSFSAEVSAPGDTLRIKQYLYSTREMQTYPNGNVRYTVYTRPDTQHYWSPNSRPNFLQRLWYGKQTAPVEEMQNWEQIIRNHPEDPRNIRKQQDGGENVFSQTAAVWGNQFAKKPIQPMRPANNIMMSNSYNKGSLSPTISNDVTTQNSTNYLNNLNAATDKINKVGNNI